jgi:hypothetical protein
MHRIEVINKLKNSKYNLWCPICEYILSSLEDVRMIKDNGCCEDCWLTFGQMRQKEWKEGWRPDSETLNRYKQTRRIINIDIMKILGE